MRRSLLLAGGGTGGIPVPHPQGVAIDTDGGTNPWNIPGAYQRAGTVYLAYVDHLGNLTANTFDEATVTAGGFAVIHASFEADVHTGPALCRRTSDGKIVAVYTKHNSDPINVRVSSSADDISAWGSATNIDGDLGGTRYTDVQLHELSDGTLFLFYRDEPSAGTDSRWCWSTSSDGGATWAAQTVLFRIASTRSYVITAKAPGSDVIHFCTTNGASSGYTKLGHFTMDGLTLARKKTDGTAIAASLPLTFTDITTAYTGTTGVQPWNVVVDGSGFPHLMVEDKIAGVLSYADARWTGSAWSQHTIATAGTGYEYSGTGTGFSAYGAFLDDADPNVAWCLRDGSGGTSELWQYITSDSGATWAGYQITSTGTLKTSPICVRDPVVLRGYWVDGSVGSWTSYTSWTGGIEGVAIY